MGTGSTWLMQMWMQGRGLTTANYCEWNHIRERPLERLNVQTCRGNSLSSGFGVKFG